MSPRGDERPPGREPRKPSKIQELVDRAVETVKELFAPPEVAVPVRVPAHRPRRR